MSYQPKGSMCQACAKRSADCSGLDFALMRVVKVYDDGAKAVKCSAFERKKAAGAG